MVLVGCQGQWLFNRGQVAAGEYYVQVVISAARRLREAGHEEIQQRIVAEGGDPLTSTPEEYAKDIDREETKWGTLVRKLNLKVE